MDMSSKRVPYDKGIIVVISEFLEHHSKAKRTSLFNSTEGQTTWPTASYCTQIRCSPNLAM